MSEEEKKPSTQPNKATGRFRWPWAKRKPKQAEESVGLLERKGDRLDDQSEAQQVESKADEASIENLTALFGPHIPRISESVDAAREKEGSRSSPVQTNYVDFLPSDSPEKEKIKRVSRQITLNELSEIASDEKRVIASLFDSDIIRSISLPGGIEITTKNVKKALEDPTTEKKIADAIKEMLSTWQSDWHKVDESPFILESKTTTEEDKKTTEEDKKATEENQKATEENQKATIINHAGLDSLRLSPRGKETSVDAVLKRAVEYGASAEFSTPIMAASLQTADAPKSNAVVSNALQMASKDNVEGFFEDASGRERKVAAFQFEEGKPLTATPEFQNYLKEERSLSKAREAVETARKGTQGFWNIFNFPARRRLSEARRNLSKLEAQVAQRRNGEGVTPDNAVQESKSSSTAATLKMFGVNPQEVKKPSQENKQETKKIPRPPTTPRPPTIPRPIKVTPQPTPSPEPAPSFSPGRGR